jgi:hypothetical protein
MTCSLQPDPPLPSALKGNAGDPVSLSLQGTAGTATMISASYDGTVIPINPARFIIRSGSHKIEMTVDNNTSGDLTQLVCDGAVLDQYLFDPGDPTKGYCIRGEA